MIRKKYLIAMPLVWLLCCLFSLDVVHAAVRRVPSQYKSIGKALEAAKPGDKILVAKGTYFEHIVLKPGIRLEGGWNSSFSKRDPKRFETVLDGKNEKGPVVIGADQAVLDGFTIIHGSLLVKGDKSLGSGIYCDKTSPIITNNVIRNNEPSGVFLSGSKAKVLKNRIYDNAQAGVYAEKGSDVQVYGNIIYGNNYSGVSTGKPPVSDLDVRNNTIFQNKRSGVNVQKGRGTIFNNVIYGNARSGITGRFTPLKVYNNTVVGNGQSGFFMEDPDKAADVRNNIFVANKDAGVRASGKGYSYNLFYKNGSVGECSPEYLWCVRAQFGGYEDEHSFSKKHNLIADPLFVDEKAHNYHLRPTSPAIDAGDKSSKFNDKYFPPSLGSKINDLGAYGGPYAVAEKRGANHPPKANAGKDMQAYSGQRVILDGSASMDPDGDALTYHWSLVSGPAKVRIVGQDRAKASVVVKKPGTYVVQLVVRDRWGVASRPAKVRIKVAANHPPKAAISDVIAPVSVGDSITLYGSPSHDPDGDKLTYHWRLRFKPAESNAVLENADGKECRLQIDADGGYAIELVVSDGKVKSQPAVIYINTKATSSTGVRRVPQDYPTIQAAIDAAQPGDNIVVQKGHYKELISIDKSVNLIGEGWPVIDGGSPKGNRNTISIFYLGDRAGKIEGFVITGGGTGELGHGINIWDSSPEIVNNKITGNHHGIGIHGSESQTGRTKIHGNLIYDNMVGIGNGKDSRAHIFENQVFNNDVVGIGCRGKAAPIIERNVIYGNHIGVGVREVSAPLIRGNRIYDNVDGVVVGPLSTIKSFTFNDIVIDGNLIAKNRHIGINITSFNKSKVVITNNTVASNNLDNKRLRAGGIVLGYPQPGTFSVVVERNIVSQNKGAGIVNYLGPEDFQKKGAKLTNDFNIMWHNTVDFLDCRKGPNDVVMDPMFKSTDPAAKDGYIPQKGSIGQTQVGYHG